MREPSIALCSLSWERVCLGDSNSFAPSGKSTNDCKGTARVLPWVSRVSRRITKSKSVNKEDLVGFLWGWLGAVHLGISTRPLQHAGPKVTGFLGAAGSPRGGILRTMGKPCGPPDPALGVTAPPSVGSKQAWPQGKENWSPHAVGTCCYGHLWKIHSARAREKQLLLFDTKQQPQEMFQPNTHHKGRSNHSEGLLLELLVYYQPWLHL